MSEVRFAAQLKSADVLFGYERDTFSYQHKPQKYTVDFVELKCDTGSGLSVTASYGTIVETLSLLDKT
jgi:hypothetical protein